MAKRRFTPAVDQPTETCRFAEKLSAKTGIPPERFRHAEYRYHNGQRWTVKYQWEELTDDGQWVRVDPILYGLDR